MEEGYNRYINDEGLGETESQVQGKAKTVEWKGFAFWDILGALDFQNSVFDQKIKICRILQEGILDRDFLVKVSYLRPVNCEHGWFVLENLTKFLNDGVKTA